MINQNIQKFLYFKQIMSQTALVIINMQSARTDKKSDYYLGDLDLMIKKINYLLEFSRMMKYKIIFITHHEKDWPFAQEHPDAMLIPKLDVHTEDTIIPKNKISAYYQTWLEKTLEGVENLVVCWVLTNLCVRMFVEESYDRGFRIALIEDLTKTFSSELQEMTLEDLATTRAELNIISLEKFIE